MLLLLSSSSKDTEVKDVMINCETQKLEAIVFKKEKNKNKNETYNICVATTNGKFHEDHDDENFARERIEYILSKFGMDVEQADIVVKELKFVE